MKRWTVALAGAIALALIADVVTAQPPACPERVDARETPPPKLPNVVIFMSDDMGWQDVGYSGSRTQTPNIDRLSAEGIQLDRFYVFPVCSPTRTAMMTGRSPIRFGITWALGGSQGVPPDEHFMPEAFRAAGYQTFMVGKWHLGAVGEEYAPQGRGFDHFYGFRGGVIDYYTHTFRGQPDWQRNGKQFEEEGYSTDLFAKEAVTLLENRDKTKPVFLYMPFNAPHGPAQAPDWLIEKYEKLGIYGRNAPRAASIDSMDQAIGKVLATLDKEGMSRNTLVMFYCDNGAGGGRERPADAAWRRPPPPSHEQGSGQRLRGGKGTVFEGGVRVPAVIRWPGVIEAGSKSSQLMSALDLLPTLTAAVGIPHGNDKPLDGENMWPSIRDGKTVTGKEVVIGAHGSVAIVRDDWKLIRNNEQVSLFDLKNDPTESRDLADEQPEMVARLKATLAPYVTMMQENPGLFPRRGPPARTAAGQRPPGRRPPAVGGRPPRRGPAEAGRRPPPRGRPEGGNRPPRRPGWVR